MFEASLTLPADLSSVSQARSFLRHALADWAVEGFELAAPQVLTELATNAALHARSAYTVHLMLDEAHLLVEVSDSSPMMPQHRHYGTGATTGRGIALVEALSEAWGVDVNVSTPRIMSALVEEAVTVGDLVRLFTFRQGNANLVELTLPADSPYVGKPTGLVPFPDNCALVSILRDGQVYVPTPSSPSRPATSCSSSYPRTARTSSSGCWLRPSTAGRSPAIGDPSVLYARARRARAVQK